jgi:S-adenosylhomocysteine hydrolase
MGGCARDDVNRTKDVKNAGKVVFIIVFGRCGFSWVYLSGAGRAF